MERAPVARRSITTQYTALVATLLAVALVVSGALETWASHRDARAALEALQREKAQAAAAAVSRFFEDLLRNLAWATLAPPDSGARDLERRRLDLLKLLRLEPAVTTATLLDAEGRERLRVSRLVTNRAESGIDLSGHPGFAAARGGRAYFGEVHFVAQTEPYLTIAAPGASRDGSVVLVEVNLKFVRTVISQVKLGEHGHAYVVDGLGRLVGHPDMSRVLRMSDLAHLPQVQLARIQVAAQQGFTERGQGIDKEPVLAAYARVERLGWTVLVEQPHAEAMAPLVASAVRTALILLAALLFAVLAGVLAARRMLRPVAELRRGAERFGAGDLSHRIEVASGDELEDLASRFNAMAEQLLHTYASLEQRVRERTRELHDANQAKSRYLAAASHDLRQPMHALRLFVEQLRTCRSEKERRVLTSRTQEAVGALSELLDRMLDFSRLEAGTVQAASRDFAILDMMMGIEAQFLPIARAKGLRLRVRPSEAWIRSDPLLVQRILLNLVANAIRYTDSGGVLVACRASGAGVRIEVWDTGRGIPDERREDVFREFVRLEGSEEGTGGGLGLGLAIVSRLANLLGTQIQMRSRVASGSVFAFDLPLGTPQRVLAQRNAYPADLRGVLVIVIDDDSRARLAMCGLLEGWGCTTLPAESAAAAMARLPALGLSPGLLLCDYRLAGGENGLEAIASFRAAVGEAIPAILITAESASLEELDGAVPVLRKPVSPVKLRALIAQLLAARKQAVAA